MTPSELNKLQVNKPSNRDILNHPDVWGNIAPSFVREMCGGNATYVPVPTLTANGREYLPLQIFTDGKSLSSGIVMRLEPKQKCLILNTHDIKSGLITSVCRCLRRHLMRKRLHIPVKEIIIREEVSSFNGPNSFQIEQISRCYKRPQGKTPGGGYQTIFKLSIHNVLIRKVDPRKLLDCRIDPALPVARLLYKKRRFYMIYESYVAGTLALHMRLTHDNTTEDLVAESSLKGCPVVFRFVEVRVDRRGVVKDLRFNVTSRELMEVDGHVIVPAMTMLTT